jgi:cytochrome c peroxidase
LIVEEWMKPEIKSGLAALLRLRSGGTAKWTAAALLACVAIGALLLRYSLPESYGPAPLQAAAAAEQSDELVSPIQPMAGLDPRKIALGDKLFHDPRFSHNNHVACSYCHDLAAGGADGRARSIGINGQTDDVNAPTVLNAGLNFSQFWDGRAETLEQQVESPIQNPAEMGSSWEEVITKLRASPEYVKDYKRIYGSQIQREGVKEVIAVFERSLTTPNSRFDRFLRHEHAAITEREQRGYALFKTLGCVSCHQGTGLGGNMYQKLGIMASYFDDRGNPTKADLGRFNVTGNPADIHMFKVPSLRNVALTAPYFHDGHARTLSDAVGMMGKYQLGRNLSDEEIELLVEFLGTLTGELDGKQL